MSTKDLKKEVDEKEVQNSKEDQKDEENDKNNEAYFLILIPSEKKINFQFLSYKTKNMIVPTIIFENMVKKDDKANLQVIVFKFKKKMEKADNENESSKSTKYEITFFEKEHIYNITFTSKNEYFIYQPELYIRNEYKQDISPEPIQQNIVPLYMKLNIFIEALCNKKELNQKEEKLYKDTIDLYKEKKEFSLLITLFLKFYEKNKELCKQIIEIFYLTNDEKNNDRIDDLKKYLKSFKDILSNAPDILNENNYNPIHFYGILFCYLHFYDEKNFPKIINEFSEGNSRILYEILIHYYSHFINPLKQNQNFFKGFIEYALKENKDIKIFERIMNYIEDIETYLFIIDTYKEEIFRKYKELRSKPFKIEANLKLLKHKEDQRKKSTKSEKQINESERLDDEKELEEVENIENECHIIVKLIESIIKFSEKEKILVIYMRGSFWINLLNQYQFPDLENIINCHKLREIYKKYTNLVNKLCEESDIKNNINIFFERDEFAFILNHLIKKFLDNNQKKFAYKICYYFYAIF